ncbi:unnamed protein product [Schistocephalus solidus]|uniref:Uncharacterized protein n=1 Tax=Schistocephalus solidus TaxID=70667 RepID=A0A3P7BZM7_SCHSO|nr:unnamed protein product [Schistocephalus solidus]
MVIKPNETLFLFDNLEDSKIITCSTTKKLEEKYAFFQPEWNQSMVDFMKSVAIIEGPKLKISSKLLDGKFCYGCAIPKMLNASPFKRHCFTVVFKKRLQVELLPQRQGNIFPIETTRNVSCRIKYDNTSVDRIPPQLNCSLTEKTDFLSKMPGYMVNGSIQVDPSAKRAAADIDAEIMEASDPSSGISTKQVRVWFAREKDLEIDFPGAHGAYATTSTFDQLCTFKWVELGDAFRQNFTWKNSKNNRTVKNQNPPKLLVQNKMELETSYFCEFSVGNITRTRNLEYKIVDMDKLKFSTRAKQLYTAGNKNFTITCDVDPKEAEFLPNFSYGWYEEPNGRRMPKTIEVENYDFGAHHMVCNSPNSKVSKLKWTFYVVNLTNMEMEIEPAASDKVYKEGTKMIVVCRVSPAEVRKSLQPNIFWQINATARVNDAVLNLATLREGAYQLQCKTDATGDISKTLSVYIVSSKAKLIVSTDNKTTFLRNEPQPQCKWSSEWMNKHSIFGITGSSSSEYDGAVEYRTITCAYSRRDLKRNATYQVSLVARENIKLRLTYNGQAFTRNVRSVECKTYPDFSSETSKVRWVVVQNHTHFKIDGNKLVPAAQDQTILQHQYGSYICVFERKDIFLTQVFVVLTLAQSPVVLKPENVTVIDKNTLLYCSFDGKASVTENVHLDIFLGPRRHTSQKTTKSTQLSFDEVTVLGGRYFVTCVVNTQGQPLWANIHEVDFYDNPDYPILEKDHIYGSEPVNCMNRAFPVFGRVLKAETDDENGAIEECGDSYCFATFSVYGYYNIQCTFEGVHKAVGFTFIKTYNATYSGPEYVPSMSRGNKVEGSFKIFFFVECLIFLLLIVIFTILAASEQKKRVEQQAMRATQKSRDFKRSVLKDLDGQYVNVNMLEFTKNDHLRLVAMTTLFDGCYDQFAKKEKKDSEKVIQPETASNYRVTMRRALTKLLNDGFNQSDSSSSDAQDGPETSMKVTRNGNNSANYK